jgi:hypothetical protein
VDSGYNLEDILHPVGSGIVGLDDVFFLLLHHHTSCMHFLEEEKEVNQ